MKSKIVSVLIAGAVCLAAAGCGGGKSGADRAGAEPKPAGTVLPQRLDEPPALPDEKTEPSPAADASFSENLEYELRRKTRDMARAEGSITAECPEDLASKSGTTTTCKTTFEGLQVEWDVRIGDKPAWSRSMVTFTAAPRQGILTRDGVARLLYGNFRGSIDYALCNDIPKAVLAPLNSQSKYRCDVVRKGEKPSGFPQPVRATDSGPRYY
ncbi:hypothetical protein B7P34_08560 [Streptosporangium nondiastaticum]|uniref:DUF4333 domain-containing protein n=1 Tax=Streptosporangium nondiastaticum TaxID=35764 RepID=A0A9X7JT09_9ACTN|nr:MULTISPECIES: hypothetical protein [Actinomycetes]PSJ29203.1 hypothetical protein B7P34_08560 [Streptosporangium nondiastaticum]WKU48656.1 hypothetical protein Q3V23_33820 [Streptomyces sp. VNUA116]